MWVLGNIFRMFGGWKELMEYFENLGIILEIVEYFVVFMVVVMMLYVGYFFGVYSKNFFFKDKKKKWLWFFIVLVICEVSLSDLVKKVGVSGGFWFVDEEVMLEKFGVG